MSAKSKNKKRHKQQGNPQKINEVKTTAQAEEEIMRKSIDPPMRRSDKPLVLRIVMLTIAAVMILGIVMGAIGGDAGAFF